MEYRNLTILEINNLVKHGCTATDWQRVQVVNNFTTDNIVNTNFSGDIRLGSFDHTFILPGGLKKKAGLYNVTLHNCIIGNHVMIENITNYIANYQIGDMSFIQNTDLIVTEGRNTFGNGTMVSVINEMGGREVPIYNDLSAHIAYIIALYRNYSILIGKLKSLIDDYVQSIASDRGRIGCNVRIINTGSIKNVCIGDQAIIEGASNLTNGSINSNLAGPIYVGCNVIAENFIISSGSHINNGVVLLRCFIGQACHMEQLFSAHDSIFFSNCQCENGEACALFAGPYCVTMHKSSLLIATMVSFINAGSGSNQSNHLYKLGAVHQGVIERGSKTTSDSYVLWPARIGAFSLIMGRHVGHPDTSDFPFSYLIEKNNQTFLVPAVNLRSVGTVRDAQKWIKRDKRTDPYHLDFINFNLLTPYTVQKIQRGIIILKELQKVSGEDSGEYAYKSTRITNSSLKRGISLYEKAVNKFLGNSLIRRLENVAYLNDETLRQCLCSDTIAGKGEWIDLSGLIAPQSEIKKLIKQIETGEISYVRQFNEKFQQLHIHYYDMEWTWAWEEIQEWYNVSIETITTKDVIRIINIWKSAVTTIDKMLYEDAQKEFSFNVQIGYGIDGESDNKCKDFSQVRGLFEENPFVQMVKKHTDEKKKLAEELIFRLQSDSGKIINQ